MEVHRDEALPLRLRSHGRFAATHDVNRFQPRGRLRSSAGRIGLTV